MTLTIFSNKKGLNRGNRPDRIISEHDGVLKIGDDRINVDARKVIDVPPLCEGHTGVVQAMFYGNDGREYELFDVTLKGGVIVPPSSEYENLALNYKLANSLAESIEEQEKRLQETRIRRQEIVTALNNNQLKYLIE